MIELMLRPVTALLLLLPLGSCARSTGGRMPVLFDPASPTRSAETSARIESILQTVPVETFEAHEFRTSAGLTLRYRALRPDRAAGPGPHPLVVLFHGSGAIGDDNRSQIGPLARSWATEEARRRFPAFLLIPQFSARSANYTMGPDSLPVAEGTELLHGAIELIHHIRATENVAGDKTYALGFSMGGSAIWHVLGHEPGLFSRAAIVAGVPAADAVRNLGTTRVLLVHGDADVENPFAAAWKAFTVSNGAVDFWRFRGLGHEFPRELIAADRLREWLFQ